MTATNEKIKQELMSRGIWPDFVRLREDAKLRDGGTSRTQTVAALEQCAPDLLELVRPRGRPRGNPPSNPLKAENSPPPENAAVEPAPEFPSCASKPTPPSKPPLADVKRSAKDARMGGGGAPVRAPRSAFDNKSCSNMASLLWAVESLAFDGVAAEDAPSALAWSLYSLMMESPSSKAEIVKVTAAKIAQKAAVDEDFGGQFDGEGEYDMAVAIAREGGE